MVLDFIDALLTNSLIRVVMQQLLYQVLQVSVKPIYKLHVHLQDVLEHLIIVVSREG